MRSTPLPRLAVAALATALAGTLALGTPSSTAAPSDGARQQAGAPSGVPVEQERAHALTQVEQERRATRALDAAAAFVAARQPGARAAGPRAVPRQGRAVAGTKGTFYVTYQRAFQGLPVYGGDFVVAVDAAGRATGATGRPGRAISLASVQPTQTKKQARAVARRQVDAVGSVAKPVLTVYAEGTPRLAWRTKVTGRKAGSPSITTVWSDARTGRVLLASDLVSHGTGNGYYYPSVTIGTSGSGSSYSMTDPARSGVRCGNQSGTTYTGTDDVWGNGSGTSLETACVDVLYATGKQVDMLSAWLGRSGVKGDGTSYPARVGLDDVNAYYNGSFVNFGHSSDNQRQVTPMDVVAHEQGHGIFATTPGGSSGTTETGGLNESTGDIFGALTEHFTNNPDDPADYLVGEEVNLTGNGPIRDMANPSAKGHPNCYSTSLPSSVHAAAGPQNHWFYLLANGTNGSTSCNGATLTGIGIQDAGKVFYNGLLLKTSTYTHAKARVATLTAARTLFGTTDCTRFNRVRDAWAGVNVGPQSGEPTCGGGTTPPGGGACSETTATGTLSGTGANSYQPTTSGFSTSGGTINACLTGPSSADFDLYVQRLSGSTWSTVARGESASSTETIAYTAAAGTYRVRVYSYRGSGSFTVKYDTP